MQGWKHKECEQEHHCIDVIHIVHNDSIYSSSEEELAASESPSINDYYTKRREYPEKEEG